MLQVSASSPSSEVGHNPYWLHGGPDSEAGGDLWNGRWTSDLLSFLLEDEASQHVDQRAFKKALQRLQKQTMLLHTAQRAMYWVHYIELSSKEAKLRRDTAIALRRKRKGTSSWTLFAASKIPYCRPALPRRKPRSSVISPALLQSSRLLPLNSNFSPTVRLGSSTSAFGLLPQHLSRPLLLENESTKPASQRNEQRTSKCKLQKTTKYFITLRSKFGVPVDGMALLCLFI